MRNLFSLTEIELVSFAIILLIVAAYSTLVSLTTELAQVKLVDMKKARKISWIPFFGLFEILRIPAASKIHPTEIANVLKISHIFKVLFRFILIFGVASITLYINWIYFALIAIFVQSSLSADIADKKGQKPIQGAILGLIPIVGFILTLKLPNKKTIEQESIWYVTRSEVWASKIIVFAEIIGLSVIVIVPVIYIFGMAASNQQSSIPVDIWPKVPTIDAFIFLFDELDFGQWYLNTLTIAVVDMVVGTVLITGASYVFARGKFRGKKTGLLALFVLQSFPSFMGLLAMYVLFEKFGLLGRPLALSILYIGGAIPGNIWLIKGYLNQITKELDEAAIIDGANKLQIFFQIILPLSVPIISFVAVGMFMGPWMDYMLPGYLLNVPAAGAAIADIPSQYTLAVGLFQLINGGAYVAKNYAAFAAGALIVGVPITVLYMVFQRYLIEGIMAGSTKG